MTATLVVRTFYNDDPCHTTGQEFTGTPEDMEDKFYAICDDLVSNKEYTQDDTFHGEVIRNRIHSKWMDDIGARHVACVSLWNGR